MPPLVRHERKTQRGGEKERKGHGFRHVPGPSQRCGDLPYLVSTKGEKRTKESSPYSPYPHGGCFENLVEEEGGSLCLLLRRSCSELIGPFGRPPPLALPPSVCLPLSISLALSLSLSLSEPSLYLPSLSLPACPQAQGRGRGRNPFAAALGEQAQGHSNGGGRSSDLSMMSDGTSEGEDHRERLCE